MKENKIYFSPDTSGGGKSQEELEREKELEKIKSQVSLINPQEPNYEDVGLGVEITTQGFEGLNLDHHKEGDTQETPSAIEQALELDLEKIPQEVFEGKKKIATVRPDSDAFGAIAVLILRQENERNKKENKEENFIDTKLIKAIGLLDRFGPGVFKAKGKEMLGLNDEEFQRVQKLCRVADYYTEVKNAPFEEKILFIKNLLQGKISSEEIEKLYEEDRNDLEKAKTESKIEIINEGQAVFIESSAKRSMEIGYEYAPVVIAYNPNFKWPDGHITPKYSIARYDKYVKFDLKGLLEELRQINPKWGGLENIIGSPQGEDPEIKPEKMKEIIKKYIQIDKIKEKD
jgi:hypothetical protein